MSYKIGVSSGIFSLAQEGEKIQYAGLAQKAHYSITKGVQFVQLDLESVSEFKEPDLKEKLEKVKELKVTFGMHSETKAFGVEASELDSAIETDYKFGHERLREILEKAGEIGSKYLLIHSSESEPFLLLEKHMQPSALVDFFGNPLRKFLEKEDWLLNWVMDPPKDFILSEVMRSTLAETIEDTIQNQVENYKREFAIQNRRPPTDEEVKIFREGIRQPVEERIKKDVKDAILHLVESRTMHFGPERFAYYFVAKWMEKNDDPLWKKIVKANAEYFAKVDNKKSEEWLKGKNIKELTVDDENFRKYNYLWVPAVSAKYIWGHLNQDKVPKEKRLYPDLKEPLKKYKMPLVLETPMAHRGIEEWLRLPNPIQMYYLAAEIGSDYLQLALDFEHMISIRLDPEKVINSLPENGGEYVRVIHAGWPSPLAPAHIPIPIGSEQQVFLYKMLYMLRQKGFGKKQECYIVFERGGGPDPIQQSVLALRKIVEYLEKDTPLDKLPLDFYGISPGEFLSPERQMVIIREHARDPLRGLIITPEEEHTALGREALIKPGMSPEKWKKEELR